MNILRVTGLMGCLLMGAGVQALAENLSLTFRKHAPDKKEVAQTKANWDAEKTALVICDMWDEHWCKGATDRVGQMAPRVNQVADGLRKKGVLVIHCPSDTMKAYENTPQRLRAQKAPKVETDIPLKRWCYPDPKTEAALPIDDSDGGCDCLPRCKNRRAWSKQIETISIHEEDVVTDSAEAFYLMKQRGIEKVIVCGVHANMCVLGRPFSIRQMVQQGQEVVLIRDLTDSMYNSRKKPFVSHFDGTRLVVKHIEQYWCPSITSDQLIGGSPFSFKGDITVPKP